MATKETPIIIKKIKRTAHADHGGSWKVAFADFATAMMAFFLVLWLSNTATPQQKRYISGYFKDPGGALIGPGGADAAVIEMQAPDLKSPIEPMMKPKSTPENTQIQDVEKAAAKKDQQRLEVLREKLVNLVQKSPAFASTRDQVHVDIVPEGIRIQIFDRENRPMFAAGSARLQPFAGMLLRKLAQVIRNVPNKVSITGHTDRIPYTGRPNYTNWELSADRANAARRQLVAGGLPISRIAKVEGLADSVLLDPKHPHNPVNRRIAIIVLKKSASEALKKSSLASNLQSLADEVNKKK